MGRPRKIITPDESGIPADDNLHIISTPEPSEPSEQLTHPTCAELEAQLAAANAKNAELEKLCKAYAEKAQNAENTLHRATMEYNARVEYMKDCVKHAYISIQFAANAASEKKGDNK